MSYNNRYYLHFVTDLKRVIFCLENNNLDGAKTFLTHANKIFEENLKQVMDGESKKLRFNDTWSEIYNCKFPASTEEQKKYSEKLLTLSSMIFLRSSQAMPVLPHESQLAPKVKAL